MLTLILPKLFSYIIIIIYMLMQDTNLQYMIIRKGQWQKLSWLTLEMGLYGNIPHIATAISDWYILMVGVLICSNASGLASCEWSYIYLQWHSKFEIIYSLQ